MRQVLGVLVLLGAGVYGWAQEANVTTLKVTSNLVVLDVVVVDKSGAPVGGLTKDDFTVYEDGKSQVIKSFDASFQPGGAGRSDAKTILVLDELNDSLAEIGWARVNLKHYLQSQQGEMPSSTMMISAASNGFKVVQGYTTDPKMLIQALDHHDASMPYKVASAQFSKERLAETLTFLQQIAIAARGEKERKNVIWVGKGFPSVSPLTLTPRDQEMVGKALRETVNLLLAARMTVSKVDPTVTTAAVSDQGSADIFNFSDDGPDPYSGGISFNALTIQTGGRFYYARNDLDREIAQGAEQGRSYYTLAYTPAAGTGEVSQAYRHLRIVVNRPTLAVQAKHGYYAGNGAGAGQAQPSQAELSLDLAQAAGSRLAYSGVVLKLVSLGPGKQPGMMLCTISADAEGLTYETDANGDRHAHVYVVASNFSDKNKMIANQATRLDTTVKAAQAGLIPGSHPMFHVEVPVAAGTKRLRIVMRDAASGRTGSVEGDPAGIPKG